MGFYGYSFMDLIEHEYVEEETTQVCTMLSQYYAGDIIGFYELLYTSIGEARIQNWKNTS